jgi:hypothetical protein
MVRGTIQEAHLSNGRRRLAASSLAAGTDLRRAAVGSVPIHGHATGRRVGGSVRGDGASSGGATADLGERSAAEKEIVLDGVRVKEINADLTALSDVTESKRLADNMNLWCYGSQQKAKFDISPQLALGLLVMPNPSGMPNSDVIRPSVNGAQVLRETHQSYVIDFAEETDIRKAALYEGPFEYVRKNILPGRKSHRERCQRERWWLHARPSPRYRRAIASMDRCLISPAVSKHRVFLWIQPLSLADHATRPSSMRTVGTRR